MSAAFRRGRLLFHPDKQHGRSAQEALVAEETFKVLQAAQARLGVT